MNYFIKSKTLNNNEAILIRGPGIEIDHKLIMNENKSFFSSLDINIKGALFVALCAFVVLLPQVNNMILSSGISQFIGEDGNITMIGTSFKCLVVGILYYIFKRFLL